MNGMLCLLILFILPILGLCEMGMEFCIYYEYIMQGIYFHIFLMCLKSANQNLLNPGESRWRRPQDNLPNR